MTRSLWIVLKKEALENLRDRRTLLSAFLFVPLMGPLLFALMTTLTVDRVVNEADEPLRLPVIGAEYAPHLLSFFVENGAEIVKLDTDVAAARAAVSRGREQFVLVIPEKIGDQLNSGEPAPVELISDSSNNKARRYVGRAHDLLEVYGRKLGALRLLARGVDSSVITPFEVRIVDVATPSSRSLVLLGTLTYFLLFSLLLGGMYLAIDVTAGERERGSLESLLCLPITRTQLVLGKIAATTLFMLMALFLTLVALVISMQFLPLEKLGMASNFSPLIALKIAATMLPMSIFGAALLFVVGSFTRSYREAQTWLGAILAVPTLPIIFAGFADVRPSTPLMTIPSLSQHLIATNLLRGDVVEPIHVAVSVVSTLLAGGVLLWIATQLYRREKLLG
ncbi:MAG TPA: ABC transporter permease [Steroidobacteraceae bacterium]|nr:ABC transporter permease [Steroidobacteraceae bacterium]